MIPARAAAPEHTDRSYHAVCPVPPRGNTARCGAQVVADGKGTPVVTTTPTGFSPAQLHSAYNLPTQTPVPQTIALVVAYDWPTAKADLDKFNSTFGLPFFPSCSATVTTACFQKVNQSGAASPLPPAEAGWAQETALDVETAHGICQNCKILLVEANSASFPNLAAAENTAATLGANVISNSYGGGDWVLDLSPYESAYNHPGVAVVAATGDSGYISSGSVFPASLPGTVAVGGTTLTLNADNSYKSETVWTGAGSGCSFKYAAQPWQTSLSNWAAVGCGTKRATADVAAVADPATGAAIYDSTPNNRKSGWFRFGGTSLATPLIAGVYGLAANASSQPYPASIAYANPTALRDISTGANYSTCAGRTICQAGPGYDGPTGLGTPNGLGGF
jgi:subtilase family serine protease